jgi:hypothetical protein
MTSIYNQNIIPQEGLFILNPYADKPLEALFNQSIYEEGANFQLKQFECYNIHKDLVDYLRRKIDLVSGVNKSFIYPDMRSISKKIEKLTLDKLVKK